jgi:hypothetical protein
VDNDQKERLRFFLQAAQSHQETIILYTLGGHVLEGDIIDFNDKEAIMKSKKNPELFRLNVILEYVIAYASYYQD